MIAPLKIVVADDEADIREFLQRILPRLGHNVVATAADGLELIELCQLHNPDLVITDVRMPNLNGIEASRQICEKRPTPCILISAYHDPDITKRAESPYIMAYLVKPIKKADLSPALEDAMDRFQKSA